MWKTRCYLFSMKCGILHVSHMNIRLLILAHKRLNFDFFTYVTQDTDFPLLNMEYSIFHIWKSRQRFNPTITNFLYAIHKTWVMISLHEIFTYLYFKSGNISPDFATWNMDFSIFGFLNSRHSRIDHILGHKSSLFTRDRFMYSFIFIQNNWNHSKHLFWPQYSKIRYQLQGKEI